MDLKTTSIKKFLEINNIEDQNGTDDIFLHGVKKSSYENKSTLDVIKSFFEDGIHMANSATARGGSILSTVALQKKDKSLSEQINNYNYCGGIYNLIIKIPRELEGLYLGNCQEKYGTGGNQDGKNAILDYFNFPNIPREFIVGISISTNEEDLSKNRIYIENPYYYDHPKNKNVNTSKLLEKLNKKLEEHPSLQDLVTSEAIDDDDIEFEKHLGNKDRAFFLKQKKEYLEQKELENDPLCL